MPPKMESIWQLVLGTLTAGCLLAFVIWLAYLGWEGSQNPSQTYLDRKLTREQKAFSDLGFNLVDPAQAPRDIRSMARRGFDIIVDTQTHAKPYCGDRLNCTNCHFAGGNTTGGSQGGISLAGAATKYPSYDASLQRVIDLPQRINNCFTRSMNGKAVPLDSDLMLALVTYLHWISKNLPIYAPIPWLELKPLQQQRQGDAQQGQRVYAVYCALCHRDDGQGGQTIPPLWGDGSFNQSAGLNQESKLASFIYWNMPYMDTTPVLTEEQAQDIAAYILAQPRQEERQKAKG